MTLPIKGLNRAMNSPWVVMINPTEEGATPKASRIRFSTGAMMLPAIMVRVAEAKMMPKETGFETPIIDYRFLQKELWNPGKSSIKKTSDFFLPSSQARSNVKRGDHGLFKQKPYSGGNHGPKYVGMDEKDATPQPGICRHVPQHE